MNFFFNSLTNKYNLYLQPTSNCLLAISGGQDSIVLLFWSVLIKRHWKYSLISLYCNHLWQTDSLQLMFQLTQINYLINQTLFLPIPFSKLQNEEIARIWRYDLFERLSCFTQIRLILTGHTNSDQVEGFFWKLIRGSGSYGLKPINAKRGNWSLKYRCFSERRFHFSSYSKRIQSPKGKWTGVVILRPILILNRYEVNKLITYFQLPIWTDKTNLNLCYQRNRIRHELLPTIRYYINSNIDLCLLRSLALLTAELEYSHLLTYKIFTPSICFTDNEPLIVSNRMVFLSLPLNIQKKYLIQSIHFLKIYEQNSNTINKVLLLLFCSPHNRFHKFIYKNQLILFVYKDYFGIKKFTSEFDGI